MKNEEKTLFQAVVVFFVRDDKILLARKKVKIGAGCLNGYGGGIEEGETPPSAAVREVFEESSGVNVLERDLEQIADTFFMNIREDGSRFVCRVHVFIAREWVGEFLPTEEMSDPEWYLISDLPFDQMLPADRHWLPLALCGQKVIVRASYGPFQKELVGTVEVIKVNAFASD